MPGYGWILLLVAVPIATVVDPRRSGRNRAIYWLVPPIVTFFGYLILERSLGGAAAFAAVTMAGMGCAWLKFYRPGPGVLNK